MAVGYSRMRDLMIKESPGVPPLQIKYIQDKMPIRISMLNIFPYIKKSSMVDCNLGVASFCLQCGHQICLNCNYILFSVGHCQGRLLGMTFGPITVSEAATSCNTCIELCILPTFLFHRIENVQVKAFGSCNQRIVMYWYFKTGDR